MSFARSMEKMNWRRGLPLPQMSKDFPSFLQLKPRWIRPGMTWESSRWKLSCFPKMFVGMTAVKLHPYWDLYMRFWTSTIRLA